MTSENTSKKNKATPKIYIFIILLTAFVIITFGRSVTNEYTYDDWRVIGENTWVRNPSNLPGLFIPARYFLNSGEGSYRPVITLSYFVDSMLPGNMETGSHLVNLLWHLLVVLLLFHLIRKLTGNIQISFGTAALYAVHPLMSEAVFAVGFREDLICAAFFLASLLISFKTMEAAGTKKAYSLAAVFLTGLAAMLSKEMGVMLLPLYIVLLLMSCRKENKFRKALPAIFVLTAATLIFGVLRFVIFKNTAIEHAAYAGDSFWRGIFLQPALISAYLFKFILPIGIKVDYLILPTESINKFNVYDFVIPKTPFSPAGLIGLLPIILVAGPAVWLRKKRPVFSTGIAWFFVTLIPVMGFLPITNLFAERYSYIPLMGLCAAFASLLYWGWEALFSGKMASRAPYYTAIIILVCVLSSLTGARSADWRTGVVIWEKTAKQTPNSIRTLNNLGSSYLIKSREPVNLLNTEQKKKALNKAAETFLKALQIYPNNSGSLLRLSEVLIAANDFENARDYLNRLTIAHPQNIEGWVKLGLVEAKLGRHAKAIAALEKAYRSKTHSRNAGIGLGEIYQQIGQYDKALEIFNDILSKFGPDRNVYNNLGTIMARSGQLEEAEIMFQKSLDLDPDFLDVRINLANAWIRNGKAKEAYSLMKKAEKKGALNPQYYFTLGRSLIEMQVYEKAEDELLTAVGYKPDYHQAWFLLSRAQAAQGALEIAAESAREAVNLEPNSDGYKQNLEAIEALRKNN
jgi:protein O-mannosyl-transferase